MQSTKGSLESKNLPYVRPELVEKGSVAELTQQTVKDFGLSDGFVLLTPDNPLVTVS